MSKRCYKQNEVCKATEELKQGIDSLTDAEKKVLKDLVDSGKFPAKTLEECLYLSDEAIPAAQIVGVLSKNKIVNSYVYRTFPMSQLIFRKSHP